MPPKDDVSRQPIDLIPLGLASARFTEITGHPSPGYRRIHEAVLGGRLRAELGNGRWRTSIAALREFAKNEADRSARRKSPASSGASDGWEAERAAWNSQTTAA